MYYRLSAFLLFLFVTLPGYGQSESGADFMESIGKIYVVVGVILVIFLGLVIYLIRMDRRIAELENQITDND